MAAMASLSATNATGMITGPGLAGWLAGFDLSLPLYVTIALPMLALLVLWRWLSRHERRAPSDTAPLRITDIRLRRPLVVGFAAMSSVTIAQVKVGFFALDRLQLAPADAARAAGIALTTVGVALILSQLLVRTLAWPPARLISAGGILSALGFGAVLFVHDAAGLWAAYFVAAAGMGWVFPAVSALAVNAVHPHEQGSAAGTLSAAHGLGMIVGPCSAPWSTKSTAAPLPAGRRPAPAGGLLAVAPRAHRKSAKIVTDILQILGIALFLSAWWLTDLPGRRRALGFAAAWAIATGVAGAFDERWQAVVGASSGAAFAVAVLLEARLARRTPRRVPWRSGTLLAALYLFPVLPLPTPSGPFAVGMRTFELVDETRRGVLYAGKDEPRRLLVRVWYPAQPAADAREAPYFSDLEARTTAHGMGERLGFPPLLSYLKHVRTHAYADAPLAPQAGKLPSVFFSHGYTSFLSQNSVLMETLASHGYAVYAVQHTYDASPSVFPNGDVLPMDPALIELMRNGPEARGEFPPALIEGYTSASFDRRLDGQLRNAAATLARGDRIVAQSASVWLADRLFVHDRLERGAVPAAAADVVAASDFARTGEMGMSFGGSVTGALCMIDKRCAAGVNLDGGDFHFLPFDADMPVPFLMLHSDSDYFYRFFKVKTDGHERSYNDFSYERFEHAGQHQDLYRLQLKGAAHNGLSDLSWFMRRPLRDALLGTAPTEIILGAQNDFVLAFFDKHLRGLKNDFPQAHYARYAGWAWPYDNAPVRHWWLAKPEAERAALRTRIAELKATAYSKIFDDL